MELLELYRRLREHFGHRHWWPGDTPFEVAVGAILTQAVAWRNVEQAVAALREAGLLDAPALAAFPEESLARLIRPARYPRQKARKLIAFADHLQRRHGGSIERMLTGSSGELRRELLALWGIGPETADSILLYAGGHPVFVVDAYTRRILHRLGWQPAEAPYDRLQAFFQERLPQDPALYNDYHAQLVALGHRLCLARSPRCDGCPLRRDPPLCRFGEATG
ncbi:MAG: endonuclease III domain-containing protein [Thermaerobacter sp.]|nr:endonuclease III domain-containing protein [Thermaerobacter sp.]